MPTSEETEEIRKYRLAFAEGLRSGSDIKKSIITVEEELAFPLEFNDYTDDLERDDIAQLIQTKEYKSLKENMKKQAMLKWRQARLSAKTPFQREMFFSLGNFLLDLINFYDQAGSEREEKTVVDQDDFLL